MVLVTNNNIMVKGAKKCVEQFCTVVNEIPLLSKMEYNFTMEDFARMDNILMQSKLGIGWSSNLAQLALSHYWNEPNEELEFAFCELAVIAQCIIDGAKRTYDINNMAEIRRYQRILPNEKPKFFKFVKEFQTRTQKSNFMRSTTSLNCPMDYLQEVLKMIPKAKERPSIDVMDLFKLNMDNSVTYRKFQIERIVGIVERYEDFVLNNKVKYNREDSVTVTIAKEQDYNKLLMKEEERFKKDLYKIRLSNEKTMNRAILFAFNDTKYAKIRRRLLRALFLMDEKMFLVQFKK